MKYFLIFLFTTSFTATLFGQNVLILKSGEKLNGKVERFRNDTLTFNFKGNKMQFKSSEIASIYFDEKEIPKEQPTTLVAVQEPEGKIAGVVTYYFNDNYGDKPDVGAKVLIINSLKVPDFHFATVDNFLKAKTYKLLYDSYVTMGQTPNNSIKENVKAYGVETAEGFDALDKRAVNELDKIRFDNIFYCTKVVADGNGTFSVNVAPGKYYVYITSNNRRGKNITEILGKVNCKEIEVKSGQTSNLNAKFDLY